MSVFTLSEGEKCVVLSSDEDRYPQYFVFCLTVLAIKGVLFNVFKLDILMSSPLCPRLNNGGL